jgi:hypothetical protein
MTDPNEPAFPVECQYHKGMPVGGIQTGNTTGWESGMTKLEHFSAMAMQGLLSWGPDAYDGKYELTASEAVAHAKALIAELNKEGGAK